MTDKGSASEAERELPNLYGEKLTFHHIRSRGTEIHPHVHPGGATCNQGNDWIHPEKRVSLKEQTGTPTK